MKNKIVYFLVYCFLMSGFTALQAEDALLDSYTDERAYNQVCWLTAHNAFANEAEFWMYTNQSLSFEEQYRFGARAFMLDLYWQQIPGTEGSVVLCHEWSPWLVDRTGLCLCTIPFRLPQGPQDLRTYFVQIKKWLDANPKEIVTLFLESRLGKTGGTQLRKLLKETGLERYLYMDKFPGYVRVLDHNEIPDYPGAHRRAFAWPTLGEMRRHNGRLVVFSDNLDDEMLSPVSYEESQYDLAAAPKCEMRRSFRRLDWRILLLMNHFYPHAPPEGYGKGNAYEAIMGRAKECHEKRKIWPNFVAVDFIEMGENGGAKAAVIELNKALTPGSKKPSREQQVSPPSTLSSSSSRSEL